MKVKRSRIGIPLTLSLLLAVWSAGPALGQDNAETASRAQADAFLSEASAALAAGELSRAGSLTESALQLSPSYSEALYLAARLEAEDRPATRAAIEHVRAALRGATWSTTDPAAARQLLISLLTRTGQAGEARREAQRLAASRPEDPRNFLLLARALDKDGSFAAEVRTASDALARFPGADDLRLQAARALARVGRSAEAAALVRTGLKVHPDSLPLLLSSAGLEIDRAQRQSAVDSYLSRGGTDPLAAVLGMESAPVRQRSGYLDTFLSLSGLSRQDLVTRVQDAVKGSRDLSTALTDALSRYTGSRDLDSDEDGAWDDRWTFAAGKVTHWTRDTAQDGAVPYEADFRDGLPVWFAARAASGAVTRFSYSRYPWLDRVDLPEGGTWFIVPYSIQCAFLRDTVTPADGTAPRIAARFSVPAADALRRGSSRIEEYAADGGTLVRRTDLDHGQKVFMEESLSGDGIMDHRVWFQGGQPQRGSRSLSRDGVFRVSETWKDGKLAAEAIDTDGDGKVDYRETFGSAPVRSWDFNEDGRDDSREYLLPDGSRLRELSTRLNGVFDVRVVTRGARIVSVTRGGKPLAVLADGTRGVTWIGEPAKAPSRPDPGAVNQIQDLSGAPYLVFAMDGILYAEALRE
jgi:tetratricopeptide (TPR) repeat protein